MSDNAKITVTLKGGTGYDAPWIVVHADNANEARDLMGQIEGSGLLADAGRVGNALAVQAALGKDLGAKPMNAPQQTPQAPQQAPQGSWSAQGTQQYQQPPQQQAPQAQGPTGPTPNCVHGPMRWVPAGTNKSGRAYNAFWACSQNVRQCPKVG